MSSTLLSVIWLAFYALATYRLIATWDSVHRGQTSNVNDAFWSGQSIRSPLSNYRRALFEETDDVRLEHARRVAVVGFAGWIPVALVAALLGPSIDRQIGVGSSNLAQIVVSVVAFAIGVFWFLVLTDTIVGPERQVRRLAVATAGIVGAGLVMLLVPGLI